MKKVPVKNTVIFVLIAVFSAILVWGSAQIRKKEYYPQGNDDKMQILVLGDSNMADFGDETIPQMMEQRLSATVYNCGVGGAAAAKVNDQNYVDYSSDLLCLYNVSKMMESRDYEILFDSFNTAPYNERDAIVALKILSEIDYEKIDYIVLAYGLNDYVSGRQVESKDAYLETTYAGALRCSIERLQKLAPNAKIIVASITYCVFFEDGTEKGDGYALDFGGGTMDAYRDSAQSVAAEYENVYFLDNLELLNIRHDNYEEYLKDGMHLNVHGQQEYTDNLVQLIIEIESGE